MLLNIIQQKKMMKRNNFNPQKYESELSPFGKKILRKLIQQWTKTNNRVNPIETEERRSRRDLLQREDIPNSMVQRGHHSYKPTNKGLLTFGESYRPDLPNVNTVNTGEETNFLNCIGNNEPVIPTSVELIKGVENEHYNGNNNLSTDDLILPGINSFNNVVDPLNDIITSNSNEQNDSNLDKSKVEQPKTNIAWGEMFDTELIPQTNDLFTTPLQQTELKPIEISNNIVSNEVPLEDTTKLSENRKLGHKRKSQSKITKTLPKKVKTIKNETTDKTDVRKQKYTKTVSNWLNNVDPNNAVEEEVLPPVKFDEKKKLQGDVMEKPKAVEINTEEKCNKRVVQAQLANRGGIMKFGKPKSKPDVTEVKTVRTKDKSVPNAKEKSSENNDKSPEPIETKTTDKKYQSARNVKDKAPEKTAKPKFIAPIKSQIPIQDVTYTVYGTEGNLKYPNLEDIEYDEVVAVLVYGNGFCQLNKQHTDDNCSPEGIMLLINDCFWYLKGTSENNCDNLKKIMHGKNIICYDGKSILIYLKTKLNIHMNEQIRDVKVGGSLIDPDHAPENFTDLQKIVSLVPQYTIATECVLQKTAWYTMLLKESYVKLKSLLMENSLWSLFVNIEMRLLPIIADMEYRGVAVDMDKINSMESVLVRKMKSVEQECYKAAGKVFQINSTVQVRALLYDELQLDTKGNVKIKETICKGAKSTSETMLRSLVTVHPLPKLILEYRHLHKAHATFLSGIAQHVSIGVVKPVWVQTAAATGRIASNNPNLQAIPKAPFSLVVFPGTEQTDQQLLNFRSVYTSRPGHSFLAADFKHIECRVFAHASADTGLLEALKTRDDLFLVLAAKWLNKPLHEISAEDRERTKRIIYASLYGAGARKLMDILHVSYEQTLAITASFNSTFPSLRTFGRSVVSRCEANGGRLSTLCGRTRLFKNINSTDFALKSHAERQAVNFIVQGSAADLCKTAMVLTHERLRNNSPPVKGHLVLQIHDELVWEVPDQQLAMAAGIIKETMESCGHQCGLPVTLPVAISSGKNWGDMRPLYD